MGVLGSIIGTVGGLLGQSSANSANATMSQSNRDWQERMDNSKHQREVSDLRKAGLNPILSAHGNGGSVPSPQIIPAQNVAGNLGRDINSSREIDEVAKKQVLNQFEKTKSEVALNNSTMSVNDETKLTQRTQQAYNRAQAGYLGIQGEVARANSSANINYLGASALKQMADASLANANSSVAFAMADKIARESENIGYKNKGDKIRSGYYDGLSPERDFLSQFGQAVSDLNPLRGLFK